MATDAARPGDIGRRVRQRRDELGMSRAEVAARAGMAEEYLAHLEEQPASLTAGQTRRLARALNVSESTLLGAHVDLPPGQHGAGRTPTLEVLDQAACRRLLGTQGIGRISLVAHGDPAPVVLPVNYVTDDGDILIRVNADGVVATAVTQSPTGCPASFEVDRIDDPLREAWSVLLSGTATSQPWPRQGGPPLEPWAGGDRAALVRLRPTRTTGRRIHVQPPTG